MTDETLVGRLRETLTGSGSVMACCHPDVLGIAIGHDDRRCVHDLGRPDDCDISQTEKFASKQACPFWQNVGIIYMSKRLDSASRDHDRPALTNADKEKAIAGIMLRYVRAFEDEEALGESEFDDECYTWDNVCALVARRVCSMVG